MNINQLILKSNLPIREISQREIARLRDIHREMLVDIISVCKKFNLTPIMAGGSCLGSVRHKGFIPWDDDLDLMMLRDDYEKLPFLLQKEFGSKYLCTGANISESPQNPFMKIEFLDSEIQTIYTSSTIKQRICIDVFPIDKIPDNIIKRLCHGFFLNILQYIALCINFYCSRDCYFTQLLRTTKEGRRKINFRLFIGRIASLFFNYSSLYNFFDRLSAKYKDLITCDVSIPTGRAHYFGEIQPLSVFFPVVDGCFEDIPVSLPNKFDVYLKALYGSYMEIPPEDKRERHYIVNIQFPQEKSN